ncbi:3-deoxy-7-phosphoheptulonate synthase [Amycolatopsis antarctica]|uniref:Phospho-2-dehydro-3-deoxyheptonate aldolase n=1 Tax=Amycolatopsis antarctica TaxID=1854586 RepID=A0A263D8V7_9PSEU|nr:3-deoxy-7-phosphoheptulonate synthase [Amycolatopsis antarctica]
MPRLGPDGSPPVTRHPPLTGPAGRGEPAPAGLAVGRQRGAARGKERPVPAEATTLAPTAPSRLLRSTRLPSPAGLRAAIPADPDVRAFVDASRSATAAILHGTDDRLLVIIGPCSVHDPAAALEYADRLLPTTRELADRLHVVLRCYVEKPRTALGWQGLVNDPGLDGGQDIDRGLTVSRRLLRDLARRGMPTATEFVDPLLTGYLADLVTWAAIGARTAQSPAHRQLCSALDLPVGIKNTTAGNIGPAVDAVRVAADPQTFSGLDADGAVSVLSSAGNPDCHVILRGGDDGPNYSTADVAATTGLLRTSGLRPRLVVDASHGNSGKDHLRAEQVVAELAVRVGDGEPGIAGVMVESFLRSGRQDLVTGRPDLLDHGRSITDSCSDLDAARTMLRQLADGVERARRHR